MERATWTDEDRKKYREGTDAFAEQMQMTLTALVERGFTREEAIPLLHTCIINQHRHEHFYEASGLPTWTDEMTRVEREAE